MTISFNNIGPALAHVTNELKEKVPNQAGCTYWMDKDHIVKVVMMRVLIDNPVPKAVLSSSYKAVKDTATVTITPPNEELAKIIADYFLGEKIPPSMGAPERPFFDVVLINEKTIIG